MGRSVFAIVCMSLFLAPTVAEGAEADAAGRCEISKGEAIERMFAWCLRIGSELEGDRKPVEADMFDELSAWPAELLRDAAIAVIRSSGRVHLSWKESLSSSLSRLGLVGLDFWTALAEMVQDEDEAPHSRRDALTVLIVAVNVERLNVLEVNKIVDLLLYAMTQEECNSLRGSAIRYTQLVDHEDVFLKLQQLAEEGPSWYASHARSSLRRHPRTRRQNSTLPGDAGQVESGRPAILQPEEVRPAARSGEADDVGKISIEDASAQLRAWSVSLAQGRAESDMSDEVSAWPADLLRDAVLAAIRDTNGPVAIESLLRALYRRHLVGVDFTTILMDLVQDVGEDAFVRRCVLTTLIVLSAIDESGAVQSDRVVSLTHYAMTQEQCLNLRVGAVSYAFMLDHKCIFKKLEQLAEEGHEWINSMARRSLRRHPRSRGRDSTFSGDADPVGSGGSAALQRDEVQPDQYSIEASSSIMDVEENDWLRSIWPERGASAEPAPVEEPGEADDEGAGSSQEPEDSSKPSRWSASLIIVLGLGIAGFTAVAMLLRRRRSAGPSDGA